jgi:hypothetical protein
VNVPVIDKLKSITKFIFDYIEYVCIDYKSFREIKKKIYSEGIESMMKYSHNLLELIEYTNEKKSQDFFKSITMKIIQLILLQDNLYYYTKNELIDQFENYNFNKENIRYFLTRGKKGIFDYETFIKLYNIYIDSINNYFDSIELKIIKYDDFNNTTILSDSLFNEFIKSPNNCTKIFEEEYKLKYNINDCNNLFLIKITPENLIDLPNDLIKKHFIQIEQRSEEWIKLIKFYKCGNNGAEIKQNMEGIYNLLRGSITESIILEKFNPESIDLYGWTKVSVGLLVEEKDKEGCIGCAPDLLLVKDNMIIPVEIKTITNNNHNNNYYSKLDLAKKQLNTIENILTSKIIYKKLIIMAYWLDTLYCECIMY